ncbi:hypothetical protein LIS77_01995 [Cytobacillus firmus]|jgi:hypothetical protein|uniref:Uncharacterized protein n=1 Tax=Cytobacillus firmus TaxID=1399 RepID=A0AA46P8I6_CYTFI|nr:MULTISPECIES: hypothetical protein [Cytobacillus]KML41944.1 hypothetical protein VL14_10700 [Cytobacillus firmus]MBG9446792.1 hypothetical protein [Cytobacillus firmus]MBG9448061.1 hypothetical protein [Cytobacillus firmus]MBG9585876.1 hypothetical protein [Cytobacillus firmus]MCC3649571.1 hypothetical protein [Cytobacillus oceanisediminis]
MGRRQVPQEMQKKSKSVHLEQWIWDLAAQMQPCRSAAIRDLFLAKMKEDLIKAGLAEENTEITSEHASLYSEEILKSSEISRKCC